MDFARQSGDDTSRRAEERKLQALAASGQLAGQARGQDIGVAGQNQTAVNRFNEWVSNLGTQQNQYAATSRQNAADRTTSERQRIGDYNIRNRQNFKGENRDNRNRLAQIGFENDALKAQLLSGQWSALGRNKDADKAARAAQNRSFGQGIGTVVGGGIGYGI
jgi:hypothetical protein